MNSAMNNYFNNLYLLLAILVSMIIHLIFLIVADLTLSHKFYLFPSPDIEINFKSPPPNNENISKQLIPKAKDLTHESKVIESKSKKKIQKIIPVKISPVVNEIKNNAASVKASKTIKKITAIDSSQILSNIKKSIPISHGNNKKYRSKKISSSTADYEYRLYFEAWRQKVERIGSLNYPEAAKSLIFGSLRLTVSLTQMGNIESIIINKSSGNSELDNAAISIVRMGSPYAKFSDRMRNEVDTVQITRTWKFTEGNRLSSQ